MDIATIFARRITEACASHLDLEPEVMLAALSVRGHPSDESVSEARMAFGRLAARVFPGSTDPTTRLRGICRGAGPRPLWSTLELLRDGLGIPVASMFETMETER
jgi:hypothetical protein